MADVKWIKIVTDIFDNRKIRQIEKMPDGDTILVIWLKLLCLAGNINDGGLIYLTRDIPYTEETLATELNRNVNTIRLALQTFTAFGMIEIVDNFLYISSWEKYQNMAGLDKIREQTRLRVAKYRETKKLQACNDTVTLRNAIDKNKIREEKDKNSISNDILPGDKNISAAPEPVFINLPLISNTDFEITVPKLNELKELYPALDVEQQLRNMKAWLLSNPKNRKTKAGIMRFITSWLSREQNRARPTGDFKKSVNKGAKTDYIQHNYSKEQMDSVFINLEDNVI